MNQVTARRLEMILGSERLRKSALCKFILYEECIHCDRIASNQDRQIFCRVSHKLSNSLRSFVSRPKV
jgi:hypothetical protein